MLFKESIKRFTPPKGWGWASISDVAKLSFSSVDKKSVEGEKAVRLCNYMDVFYNRRIREGMSFMASTASDSDIKKFTLNKDDVVLTKDSETPEEIAFAAVIDEQIDNLVCGYHLAVLRPDKAKVTGEYLMSAINFHPNHHQFVRLANGATRFGLGIDSLNNALIPLPPLAEQRKIAEILRTWDEAIETAEAELKAKQERKRWMMEKFMSRRPVHYVSGRELRIGTIEQFELAGIITLSRGKVISKNDIEGLPGTYPVYSSSIHNNGLFGRYGDYMFDEEMITWSVDGGGNFFHRPKHRFSITNVCGSMQVDTKRINCSFLATQLQYLHKRLTFDYQSKAHPSVIRKMYNLWIPSIEEQVSMADAMAICDEQMLNLSNRIKALCAQKRGLMQKLLTGVVRVAA